MHSHSRSRRTKQERIEQIKKLVQEESPITPTKIASYLNICDDFVIEVIRSLHNEGTVDIRQHRTHTRGKEVWSNRGYLPFLEEVVKE